MQWHQPPPKPPSLPWVQIFYSEYCSARLRRSRLELAEAFRHRALLQQLDKSKKTTRDAVVPYVQITKSRSDPTNANRQGGRRLRFFTLIFGNSFVTRTKSP